MAGQGSRFRENGKPESRTIVGQGGRCGGRRGAVGVLYNLLKINDF